MIKIYQVDAFTDQLFSGNPAAVCPLNQWLEDDILQRIAAENNLSETAFYVKKENYYDIRWFTPTVEVDLCGHATLAAAYVLFNFEGHAGNTIAFHSSRSGSLPITKSGDFFSLDFPVDTLEQLPLEESFQHAIGISPIEVYKGKTNYMFIYQTTEQISTATPNLYYIQSLNVRGLIITSQGKDVDFVSRFFAPQSGVDEDPVTGSAHTTLTPYWARQLRKKKLTAMQLSSRMGFLKCESTGDRVKISGKAKPFLIGEIML
ncbi:PhzF family phenazine biosynthesis isomerase [Olivibacter sp. SDN3]|uniref:PhzF family phenazine biosynthesis protein n=1 Tax=Olivibacter sp. SDN3 TaxID=2764720 RepID=UPI001650EEF2|nr:PhzF family phenazine biosynthesis isomerase [Olivibacter sp. SDN3]QNL49207.1 PhzF family phenazine biosynthesis isomerase [Olivibacter sp. SDN3]